MNLRLIADSLREAFGQFRRFDLRWSYIVTGVAVALGVIVQLIFAHGWVVWPGVFVVSLLTMVHEAADRNDEGVPPLAVYALFTGALVMLVLWLMVMKFCGPWLMIVATPPVLWYAGKGYLENRKREQLIEQRRKDGQCVGCGEEIDKSYEVCPYCGLDLDPDSQRLSRVANVARSRANTARGREVIKGAAQFTHAQRRAKALAERRDRPGGKPR